MAVLFCGSTKAEVNTSLYEVMTAGYYDPLYQQSALAGDMEANPAAYIDLPVTVTGEMWLHYRLYNNRNTSSGLTNADGIQCSFYDEDNLLLARIKMDNGSTRAEAHGDTQVNSGYNFAFEPLGRPTYTFDIRVEVDGSNIVIDYYVNGALLCTATAANTVGGKTGVRRVVLDNNDIQGTNGSANSIQEIIITEDENTIGWRLATLIPESAGTYTQWAGDYTHLLNSEDGRFLLAAETGIRESWFVSGYNGPTTPSSVRGVFVGFNGIAGETGPQTYAAFLRIGGSDYEATPQTPVEGVRNLFEFALDPSTVAAWNTVTFDTMEVGVRTLT